jgi:hypothetical protein
MSRFNYATTRNKPITISVVNKVPKYKLDSADIKALAKSSYRFNEWETKFYNTVKFYNFKIVSGKQWNIVKQLLSKYSVPSTTSF